MDEIARKLVENPKGIFAADESGGSINKKFDEFGIEFTEENRRLYRQLFITTPGYEKYTSGVILFDETARQHVDDGRTFVKAIADNGVIPGIKVDKGITPIHGYEGEGVTAGLDGLSERLQEYRAMGLRFAKWRAALYIQNGTGPSDAAIAANVHALARYAAECQAADIVPIVEPELVHAGYYSIEEAEQAMARILDALFDEMNLFKVRRQATILKTSMVLAGKDFERSNPHEIADATLRVFRDHVPHDLAGIVFLSGGQSVEQATENLAAISSHGKQTWPITFSYARALQHPAIAAWQGKHENVHVAQQAFLARLEANSEAVIKQAN